MPKTDVAKFGDAYLDAMEENNFAEAHKLLAARLMKAAPSEKAAKERFEKFPEKFFDLGNKMLDKMQQKGNVGDVNNNLTIINAQKMSLNQQMKWYGEMNEKLLELGKKNGYDMSQYDNVVPSVKVVNRMEEE